MSPAKSKPPTGTKPYFSSVAVVVSDRKKAREWYTSTLGLDLIDDEEHWVTVGRRGRPGVLHLCQTTEFDPKGTLEPGNSGILLRLPGKDFAASCAELKSRGVPFHQEPRKDPWGWWASIRDPDGNEHVVMPEP